MPAGHDHRADPRGTSRGDAGSGEKRAAAGVNGPAGSGSAGETVGGASSSLHSGAPVGPHSSTPGSVPGGPHGSTPGARAHMERSAAAGGGQTLSLGTRLRQARQAQRRTLADVAEASGLTKGFVSKLENDQVNASVASLVRLCDTLGMPVGSLFEPAAGSVVRASAYPPIEFGGERMREYVLTPQSEQRVQALVSDIDPGGGSGPGHYRLPTEVEFAFVLRGRLEIDLADLAGTSSETVILERGDAFTFPADNRHVFRALAEDEPTRVLWVFSPALPAEHTWREHSGGERGDAEHSGQRGTKHSGGRRGGAAESGGRSAGGGETGTNGRNA